MKRAIMKRISPELIKQINKVKEAYQKSTGKKISFVQASRIYSTLPTRVIVINKSKRRRRNDTQIDDLIGWF